MARETQNGPRDQVPTPRMALRSTPGSLVSLSVCGLRTPQRLGAGRLELRVRGRGSGSPGQMGAQALTQGSTSVRSTPTPTPARPFFLPHLDSILVNLLIRDLPGAVPPHLSDRGLVLEAIIQAEGCNHVLKALDAGGKRASETGQGAHVQGNGVLRGRWRWGPWGHTFQAETLSDAAVYTKQPVLNSALTAASDFEQDFHKWSVKPDWDPSPPPDHSRPRVFTEHCSVLYSSAQTRQHPQAAQSSWSAGRQISRWIQIRRLMKAYAESWDGKYLGRKSSLDPRMPVLPKLAMHKAGGVGANRMEGAKAPRQKCTWAA